MLPLSLQGVLQFSLGINVQMVCRLVEQENIGLGIHDLAQTYLLPCSPESTRTWLSICCVVSRICKCGTLPHTVSMTEKASIFLPIQVVVFSGLILSKYRFPGNRLGAPSRKTEVSEPRCFSERRLSDTVYRQELFFAAFHPDVQRAGEWFIVSDPHILCLKKSFSGCTRSAK